MSVRHIQSIIPASLLLMVIASLLFMSPTHAFSLSMQDGAAAARGDGQATNLFGSAGVFTTITNVLLFIIGAIAVIMIILGGFRYVISGGNATSITAAKNTILYAIIGLVVAILAYAIIHFVISTFTGAGSGTFSAGTNT